MKQINSERLVTALTLLLAAFLGLGLFSQAVHNNSHNEQMYVTAGYLLAQGERLYTDFAFVQTPYSPLIYAAVFKLTGGYYLFSAKLVNFAFLAFAAGLLWLLARRRTRDDLFSAALLSLFLANYYLLRAAIEASNYTIPIAFSLAAYALFLRYIDRPRRPLAFFAAGALLAAAVGAKLYYATLLAPFALAALLYPVAASLRSRIIGGLLPLAGGTVAGALPLLYYAARDWERFAFNNLGYHLLNTSLARAERFRPHDLGNPAGYSLRHPRQPQLLAAGRLSGAGSRHPVRTERLLPASPAPARGGHHPLGAAGCGLHRDGLHAAAALSAILRHARAFSCSRCCSRLCSHRPAAAGDVATPDADRCRTAYARRTAAAYRLRGASARMTAGRQ